MSINSGDNQTDKKALQAKEKTNFETKQGTEKPEKSEKTEKARKKKEVPEKKVRVVRKQHFGFRDEYNLSKKEERPKSQPAKARHQSNHLL